MGENTMHIVNAKTILPLSSSSILRIALQASQTKYATYMLSRCKNKNSGKIADIIFIVKMAVNEKLTTFSQALNEN